MRSVLSSFNPSDDSNRVFFESAIPPFPYPCLLISVSTVDSFFHNLSERRNPKVPPQSLLVMSRNSTWKGESIDGKHMLKGRGVVISAPVKIGAEIVVQDVFRDEQKQLSIDKKLSVDENVSSKDTVHVSLDTHSTPTQPHTPIQFLRFSHPAIELEIEVFYLCIRYLLIVSLFLFGIWVFYSPVS